MKYQQIINPIIIKGLYKLYQYKETEVEVKEV